MYVTSTLGENRSGPALGPLGVLGKTFRCVAPSSGIAVARAVERNRFHARDTGWGARRGDILKLLNLAPDANDSAFAVAVAFWQCMHDLEVDGILGKNTWQAMLRAIAESKPAAPRKEPHELLAEAIAAGNHDVGSLTNLVFFARHPELGGRRLRPEETKLQREWLAVRDDIVIPALLGRGIPVPAEHIRGKRTRTGVTQYQSWIDNLIRDWRSAAQIATLEWVDRIARDYHADREEYRRFSPKPPKDGQEIADLGLSVLGFVAKAGGPLTSTPVELLDLGVKAFRAFSKEDPPLEHGTATFLGHAELQHFIQALKVGLERAFESQELSRGRTAHAELFRLAPKGDDESTYRRLIEVAFPDLPPDVREAQIPVLGKGIGPRSSFLNAVRVLTEDRLWKLVESLPEASRRAVRALRVGNRPVPEALALGVTPPDDMAALMRLVRTSWGARRVLRYRRGRPQLPSREAEIYQQLLNSAHSSAFKVRLSAVLAVANRTKGGGLALHLSVPLLVDMLRDREEVIRATAAAGLAGLGAIIAIPDVIQSRLRTAPGSRLQRSFAHSLRKLGEAAGG